GAAAAEHGGKAEPRGRRARRPHADGSGTRCFRAGDEPAQDAKRETVRRRRRQAGNDEGWPHRIGQGDAIAASVLRLLRKESWHRLTETAENLSAASYSRPAFTN